MSGPGEQAGGPAAREVDAASPRHGRLERAIAAQLKRLRQARGLTLAETAARTGISAPMLSKIENATISCSLSTLDRIAEAFEVPVTALFRGADTLREAVYTPAGAGARIAARGTRVGHDYTLVGGLGGPHKRMEAHIVTLTEHSLFLSGRTLASPVASMAPEPFAPPGFPGAIGEGEFPVFQHAGTELLYMLEGEMVYRHEDTSYRMRPGDTLQLDGEGVHGPRELTILPIRFLSIVAYGDADLD